MGIKRGIYTAIATPFKNGKIDFDSLLNLIRFQKSVSGFVVAGTTGESPTLSIVEIQSIFEFVVQHRQPHQKVIVGTGTNCTRTSAERTQEAEKWGADAALVVVPYYNKPNQQGLFQHYQAIADKSDLDLIAYNVPTRTITGLSLETVIKLAESKTIAGLKDATGDLSYHQSLLDWRSSHGSDLQLFSGDDGSCCEYMRMGGDGVISVASHLIPEEFMSWLAKGPEIDLAVCKKYESLFQSLGIISNPIPLKMALKFMGQISSAELRLPLVELIEELSLDLKNELDRAGVLK